MIHLLTLFCSLIIQFGAIGYPVDYTPVNQHFSSEILTVWENLVSAGYNVDIEKLILINRSDSLNPSGSAPYAVFYPAEPFNQIASSIIVTSQSNNYIQVNSTNFYRWLLKSDFSISSGPSVNNIGKVGIYDISTGSYTNSSGNIMYNNYYVMPLNNDFNSPTFSWSSEGGSLPSFGGLGSLSPSGHSVNGDPGEDLLGFTTWSSASGQFALTGHSVGVSQNQSTPDFTNPVQNLLGQIVDNTNKIIENIKGVGDILSGLVNNIRQGFSAVFNAISQFNNNFVSFCNYVTEPLDQDMVMDYVDDMSFMQLSSSISSAGSHITSSFSNVSNNQTLIFPIDLRNTIFSNAGIMYLDLSFLDDSKSTWQPLLIAFLYITLAFNILMALPSIIQGQSREGGKSD